VVAIVLVIVRIANPTRSGKTTATGRKKKIRLDL